MSCPASSWRGRIAAATRDVDWNSLRGIVLLQHGIFSFHGEARDSYESMIELVDRAERELLRLTAPNNRKPPREDSRLPKAARSVSAPGMHSDADMPVLLSCLRKAAGNLLGAPVLARLDSGPEALRFAMLDDCGELIRRGPLTPDHTIHGKPFGAVFEADPLPGLGEFERDYLAYFRAHAEDRHQCLDPAPRYGVWRDLGMVYFAPNGKRLAIVADITAHTIRAIQLAEAIGGWRALPRDKLFEVEYWELEQVKLAKPGTAAELQGKIAPGHRCRFRHRPRHGGGIAAPGRRRGRPGHRQYE